MSVKEDIRPNLSSKESIHRIFAAISQETLLPHVLDAIPNMCAIVDRKRQIVFANKAVLQVAGTDDRLSLCGTRVGEILGCVHAGQTEAACGGSDACGTCGALDAIVSGGRGVEGSQECRIIRADGHVMDLRVWAVPIDILGGFYTVVTLVDISDEKRRRVLERLFFHDVLNTAAAMQGFCELLRKRPPEDGDRLRDRITRLSKRLIEEIDGQKQLNDAESGDLRVNMGPVSTANLLLQVLDQQSDPPVSGEAIARVHPDSEEVTLMTDAVVLRRVLGNLLKNALEASSATQEVTVRAQKVDDAVVFMVHNPAYMARNVQFQVFQRSFSTKGTNRGLGTYSAKLLTESYLGGRLTFESSEGAGTVFRASFPLVPERQPPEDVGRHPQESQGDPTPGRKP